MSTFTHDPDATLDYVIDWSLWLDDDTINGHAMTVDPESGVTIDTSTHTTTRVTAWVSGGTAGTDVSVTCHIVTTAGREDDRTIWLKVRER